MIQRGRGSAIARRVTAFRLMTIVALVAMAAITILPHAVGAQSPYSTISPQTKQAEAIHSIYKLIFWMALVVFVGVQVGLIYTVLRYRRRHEDEERPEQVHGNKTLEIVWTILPAIVLLIIFIPTVRTLYDQAAEARDGDIEIEVYGKQWWWEFHYKRPDTVEGVITANEIRVPQGKKVLLKLYSNNVIHSFWVPQLAGKIDLIPGHENKLAFTPEIPGYYFGQCAEFCGDSHAYMQFKVIVEPEEQFNQWIEAWKAGPTQASAQFVPDGDVTKVPAAFGLCLACHRVEGTNAQIAPEGLEQAPLTADGGPGSAKTAGPNLTLFGCRTTIAAGVLKNDPEGENLAKWLRDPGSIKPGNYMATVIQPGLLNEEQIQELVGYLESLKPEGGCPPIPGLDQQPDGGQEEPS